MCGILALYKKSKENYDDKSFNLESLKARGEDYESYKNIKNFFLYQSLHSTTFFNKPIFEGKGILLANCEIYNYKSIEEEYNKKYNLNFNSKNDTEFLLNFLDLFSIDDLKNVSQKFLEFYNLLEGQFAIIYYREKYIFFFRDFIGLNPLVYYHDEKNKNFIISSTKKFFYDNKYDYTIVREVHPRNMYVFNIKNFVLKQKYIPIIFPYNTKSLYEELKSNVKNIIFHSKKLYEKNKIALAFSGGIDSLIIALLLKSLNLKVDLINVYVEGYDKKNSDFYYSKILSEKLGFKLIQYEVKKTELEEAIKKVALTITEPHSLKVTSGLTTYFVTKKAKSLGYKIILSGSGSDEIFLGYYRSLKNQEYYAESFINILQHYEKNAYKEDIIAMNNSIELRYPFFSKKIIVSFWKKIVGKNYNNIIKKKILRSIIKEKFYDYKEFSERPKKASQYINGFDKEFERIIKSKSYKSKSEYLKKTLLLEGKNISSLISTGKDSLYSCYTLKNFNYNIKNFITIKSKNKNSYMYHTPNINFSKIISKITNTPIILKETIGVKEEELKVLKEALKESKKNFFISGFSSGAIKSNYQRNRLILIGEELGLEVYNPLWQKNEEEYYKKLLKEKFEIIIVRASFENAEEFVGKKLSLDLLKKLKEKKISIIGEGGEFETLVLDCPLYNKKIVLEETKIKKIDEYDYILEIKKYKLEEK